MLIIDEDPLRQVKFVRLFTVIAFNLHEIMMKLEIKRTDNFNSQTLFELMCFN